MENEFISKLKNFLLEDDALSVSREMGQLKNDFDDWLLHSEGKQQVETLKAKEEGKEIEQIDFLIIKEEFNTLFSKYKETKKQQIELKNKLELENLKLKMSLIADLKNLVENEENIGTAFNGYNSIQDTWKKIGDIPRDKRANIQKEYSKLRELFSYNIKIYKEIKDYDYKRNAQLKEGVIMRIQTLRNKSDNIKDLENTLRLYQDEWEDIGPVQKEEWDGLKTSYWEAVRSIYDKINKHYEQHRASQQENLKKKKTILNDLNAFLEAHTDVNGQKEWNKLTDEVLKFQESWKKIGFAPRKENDAIWKQFRGLCDSFFGRKKEFYKSRDNNDKDAKEAKQALITKANELKDSEDWKEATHAIIQLQKTWKTLKGAGRYEKKLWEDFRSTCDYFFNKKEERGKAQDKILDSNLAAKNEFIKGISSTTLASSDDVKKLVLAFQQIGAVAAKEGNELHKQFNKALRAQLKSTDMSNEDVDLILFKARIDGLADSGGASSQYQREKSSLRVKITSLENELIKAETNLGYFSVSKGAEKLFAQVNEKNEMIKQEIALLKRKLKLIPNE